MGEHKLNDLVEDTLQHYGVLGMKWGVRKDIALSNKKSKWDEHNVKLSKYKGDTYFISEHNMNGETLTPRVPKNYFTDNGYEDDTTNRVSFAPSVKQALMGLSQDVSGKKYYVHAPDGDYDIYKPDTKAVPDSKVTGELWVKEKVKLKKVGEVQVGSDSGKPGEKFTYGDNSSELYEFDYEWVTNDSKSISDTLKHYGVLGMKWGVRRTPAQLKNSSHNKDKPKGKIRKNLDSMKREREWNKVLKNVDNLSTSDIRKATTRVSLENDMKKLTKSKVANAKDKENYLRRGKMSNQELSRKVTRLRAKDNLLKSVKAASKEQREFGEKVVNIGSSLVVKYAKDKSITPKDILNAYDNPKESGKKARQDLLNETVKKLKK